MLVRVGRLHSHVEGLRPPEGQGNVETREIVPLCSEWPNVSGKRIGPLTFLRRTVLYTRASTPRRTHADNKTNHTA